MDQQRNTSDGFLASRYDHKEIEKRIYERWEKSGYFNPDNLEKAHSEWRIANGKKRKAISHKPYAIIMPPPNANGHLHAGHGLDMTLKDILIRYKRMRGFRTLWLPGADHAGFETQIVYEKKLEKEGRSRFDLGREELYKEVLAFTLENKKHMEREVRALGASCDWSREKFTLDPDVIKTVHQTFKKLYDDGLVYRGKRIINWCSKHQTSLSDVETEFKEKTDPFYYFRYGPFVIGTARPETKFGDKYVVMHPSDKRYAKYKDGEKIDLEWINGPVTATIIKDKAVDMAFGTGVMTITPWHDAIDFDIAERHKLDKEQIIDFRGKLLPIAGEFAGMKAVDARNAIVEKLKTKGLVEKIDSEYKHSVRVCYKCENTIEPQIRDQWFVKMEPLAKLAMKPVREKKITFIPKHTEKVFFHWMKNAIDWNISRQIVWGIRIPAWFRFKGELAHLNKLDLEDVGMETSRVHDGEIYPSPLTFREDLAKVEEFIGLEKPKGEGWIQDPDVFDTWFSSGQWPLVTLGYPDHKDFKTFYPTDMMETGADLVFKWVPRMIIFGMYLAKKIPFRTVYFHGMVNDAQNRKMSKSKGNVVSPI